MSGPEGCPECGGVRIVLDVVRVDRLVKRCAGCGHRWNEEREPPAEPVFRGGYIDVAEVDRLGRR
jgi:hypothetical protein